MSDAILVIGGGMTGLRAALEVASAGSRAILLERGPILGGKRAALLHSPQSPDPQLATVASEPAIDCYTLAQLVSLHGEPGNFTARVQVQPRFVTDDCTRCNHCVPVCPEVVPNEYDEGLTFRKAIHSPLPQTIPDIYCIDIDSCLNSPPNYLPCQRCAEACDDLAIRFDMPVPAPLDHAVAAVIVATGFGGSAQELAEFGYGAYADILSAAELQRLLEDPGPSGGFAVRPSDGNYPQSVLLVLTAVTDDAAWILENHLRKLAAQDVGQLEVLVLSATDDDPVLSGLLLAAQECGADLYCGAWIDVQPADSGALSVAFAALPRGDRVELTAELVALYAAVRPDSGSDSLATLLRLALDERGYLSTSRPGIYLAGGVTGTVGVETSGDQARAAASAALAHIATQRTAAATQATAAEVELRREDIEHLLQTLWRLGAGGSG